MNDPARIAVVTPSFSRDFQTCRELNESVLTYFPSPAKHYVIVDSCDVKLFQPLANNRTIVAAVEDVIPRGYFKLRYPNKWWFSVPAFFPLKGWLVQQLVKLSAHTIADEPIQVNVDSDVRFVRPVDPQLFRKDGRTRMYRLPGGVTAGMQHVKWHKNVSRLLGVSTDPLPIDDHVGNVISWDRRLIGDALRRIEAISGKAWHVALTHDRNVAEQMVYGLYVDKVIGTEAARVWIDERSWCHTYWGPAPLQKSDVETFVRGMRDDDIAFSIAGYTHSDPDVTRSATQLAVQLATSATVV